MADSGRESWIEARPRSLRLRAPASLTPAKRLKLQWRSPREAFETLRQKNRPGIDDPSGLCPDTHVFVRGLARDHRVSFCDFLCLHSGSSRFKAAKMAKRVAPCSHCGGVPIICGLAGCHPLAATPARH